jgi:hypothetical protein
VLLDRIQQHRFLEVKRSNHHPRFKLPRSWDRLQAVESFLLSFATEVWDVRSKFLALAALASVPETFDRQDERLAVRCTSPAPVLRSGPAESAWHGRHEVMSLQDLQSIWSIYHSRERHCSTLSVSWYLALRWSTLLWPKPSREDLKKLSGHHRTRSTTASG